MEITFRMDLHALNEGTESTIRRQGYRKIIIDVSFASQGLFTFVVISEPELFGI